MAEIIAMVDSGAFTTCLPRQLALDLGISDHELVEDPDGGTGVGSTFRIWRPTVPILASIGLFEPAEDGSVRIWGPGFYLQPVFTDADNMLLGRADFFSIFAVRFTTLPTHGDVFVLEVMTGDEPLPDD